MWKVIAADDEGYIREALQKLINWEKMDCSLESVVSDGQELLEKIRGEMPDIVITDIQMPGVDGLEVCKYVYETCPETQVIILTAYSDFEYAKRAIKYSVCEYVLKISIIDELPLAVEKAIGKLSRLKKEIEIQEHTKAEEPESLLDQIEQYLEENFRKKITLDDIADTLHVNRSYLSRYYKNKTGVNLFDEILMKRVEKAKEYLGKICSSGNLLMTIINQILEIARIESGTIALQLKAEDINAVFHTVNTVFEEDIRKKNLQYSADLDVYHTFIFCDRVKLQEIMLNIISNAIKYTSDGHAVHVKIYEKDSENPRKARFIFTCEDTGIGMSEEYLPHIFEEFSREHTTTENKVAGTGLGLPIVKSMIELMGGSIQVESTQGVGTKFTVDISFDMASEADVYRDQISEQPDVLEKLEGKRILLAEDNDLNAEIAIELLAEQKIITDRAEDGAECLDKLEKADSGYYDMILMDIQMPVMDGYDAAARIRRMKDEEKASIPIIAMTANAFAEDRQKAISTGMNDHVAKPIDMNVLLPVIAKYIR